MNLNRSRANIALAVASLAAVALAGTPGKAQAQRQSGIQLSPQSNRYFISKDVGQERWAITYNLDDKTVTGNVFPINGGAPTFLSCDITRVEQASDPANSQYFMDCRAASPCDTAPCANQWGPVNSVGPIPGSFLLPSNTRSTYAGNVQPIYNSSCATSAVCHGNGANYVVLATASSYENTFRIESNGVNGAQGPFILPFDPSGSFLYRKLDGTGAGEPMPYNGSALPSAQIELIRNWILEGAAKN
jgi:hypothetical protein